MIAAGKGEAKVTRGPSEIPVPSVGPIQARPVPQTPLPKPRFGPRGPSRPFDELALPGAPEQSRGPIMATGTPSLDPRMVAISMLRRG